MMAGYLRADHGGGIQRAALPDGADTLQGALHKAVVDTFLNQGAARTGADFALIQGEHGKPFQRLIKKVVVLCRHIFEEDVGRFAAKLERDRSHVFARVFAGSAGPLR